VRLLPACPGGTCPARTGRRALLPESPAGAIAAGFKSDAYDGQIGTVAAFGLPLDHRTQRGHFSPEGLNLAG